MKPLCGARRFHDRGIAWLVLIVTCLATMALVRPSAAQSTAVVTATADTYLTRSRPNLNNGSSGFLRISPLQRSLVRFSLADIQTAIGGGTMVSAMLALDVAKNADNWPPRGAAIDAHRVLRDWAEGTGNDLGPGGGAGATWNCATDSETANDDPDCDFFTAWTMSRPLYAHPWVTAPTASAAISNDTRGTLQWDVTPDVAAFLSGTAVNDGWLLQKSAEPQRGTIDLNSRESTKPPRLVISFTPPVVPCDVTFTSVSATDNGAGGVLVQWQVSAESGITGYTVQRSGDGVNFSALNTVPYDGSGSYSFTDATPLGSTAFYQVVANCISGASVPSSQEQFP